MKNKNFDPYEAPNQEIFDDLKEKAIEIWNTYDDTYGYRSEKIARVNSITNFKDNAWSLIGMFDPNNQAKLLLKVKPETRIYMVKMLTL